MQRQTHTSKKTHAGGPSVLYTMRHPPLDLAALFRSIGYYAEVRCFPRVDEALASLSSTFVIEFIDDVTLDLNTFECFRLADDGSMTLHMHPETRQVVEQLNDHVIAKFFDVHGYSIGLVYFDVNERIPSVTKDGLKVTAHVREGNDTFVCRGARKDSPCSKEEACDHMCELHCAALDPDWKDTDLKIRCACEVKRDQILTYDSMSPTGRSYKRARIGY